MKSKSKIKQKLWQLNVKNSSYKL